MSNILRSKSDVYNVYNFTEETKSGKKVNKRQRSKTTSLTSKPIESNGVEKNVKTVKDGKWRCNAFKTIISTAVWINGISPKDKPSIESVIDSLFAHITDECKCASQASTLLLIANSYYELFMFKLKEFEKRVTHEEESYVSCEEQIPVRRYANRNIVLNDIPVNKGSKFESNIMTNLVNLMNMTEMVFPLKKAIDYWNEALDSGLKNRTITDESLIKLKVYYNISTAFQLFAFYNMHEYQLKAAFLLDKFCRFYSTKQSEIRLTAYYYLVKSYIELGAIKEALSCLRNCAPLKSLPETYGTSLILLAKCELDLLNGKEEKAAQMLKLFLNSEYLKKLTINRYYIKGLALMIASKFNGSQFAFSNSFQEFLEPIQMAICILKRWHPFLSINKSNNENAIINAGELDPIWYRFAVINFAFNAMQLSASFYMNIGMPVDAIFYYNSLIKLGRRHCAVFWLSKLLIIGSEFDMLCDHKYSAKTKLTNASSSLYISPYNDTSSVFSFPSSVSTISPDTRRAMDGRYLEKRPIERDEYENDPIMTINPTYSDSTADELNSDVCAHEKDFQFSDLLDIKKKLIKFGRDVNNSDLELDRRDKVSSNLTKSSEEINCDDFIDLFLIKLEIDFKTLLIDENDSQYILRQLKDIHLNSIESFTSEVLTLRIRDILKNDGKRHSITRNEIQNYGPSKELKFRFFELIAKYQIKNKEFVDAINSCNEITGSLVFSYNERMVKSELLYLEAFSRLQLWLQKYSDFTDYVWFEFNNGSVESISDSINISIRTPSPTQKKGKNFAPKAPKHKNIYKSEEVKDYMNALKNAVYNEMKEKPTNSTSIASSNKRIPLQSKNNKLNFESDSISRSIPKFESNPLLSDAPIDSIIGMNATVKQKSKESQRITRSRSASVKINKETLITKISTTQKSSKHLSSEEIIEISSNDSFSGSEKIEDLDEVFQNLNINEETILCEVNKFSKDSINDLESIINILLKVLDLMSTHPNTTIYGSVHRLLTQIYSLRQNFSEDIVGYHFSESSNSASFRYRNLFIADKKRKLNKKFKYNVKQLVFNNFDNSLNSMIHNLPNDWRIIQISTVYNNSKIPDLLVCRFQNGKRPVFLKIKSNPEKIMKDFMTQFNDIIVRSNASIINKDRETFWRLRFSLDEELMILLRSVEEKWFGPFRGIFFGQLMNENYQKMCLKLKDFIINYGVKESLICVNEDLLEVVIESLPSLKYNEFKTAINLLFKLPSIQFISKCFAKYEELFVSIYPIENKESIFTAYNLSAVGLILDKTLESFPFESLPSLLSYNQSIFRTPSLRVLSLMTDTFKDDIFANGVDDKKVYYVLNPANNLSKTEEYFKESFKSVKEWEGVVGRAPQSQELKNAFECLDVYIFFGHGAGASYYRSIPEGLDGCAINTSSIIIGCSSGKLFSEGPQLESYGTPYRFIMNGSPSYVGVLWDVTDKDIDKFSDQLLNLWFSNWKPESNVKKESMPITKAVCMSRNVCKLKHLIGSAPVVYGLPLFTRSKTS